MDRLRMIPGARWWSLDLHAHSPASFDFGGTEGERSKKPKPSFKAWLKTYVHAEVDGIVVTDHNSHEGIDAARSALAELREEDPRLRPLVIFPGVELTATGGTHILGVFDPDTPASTVNDVLVLCDYKGDRGESNATANKTVVDIARIISEAGGLCIPAHADQSRGVFEMDSRDLKALVDSRYVLAAEVVDDLKVGEAQRRGWVPVLGSDAHHLTTDGCPQEIEAKAPGTHVTLIKAETLNLEGLRLSLMDSAESIRRERRGYSDPNGTLHGHIREVAITRHGHTETYTLGPWMNCVIGGRGVGKSTIIEAVRLALGRANELSGAVAADLSRFHPAAESTERWWDADTRIVVHYAKGGQRLRIIWTGTNPETPILEASDGTAWARQSGKVSDRVPVRIFSQKQIYELATTPQSFLAILDDMPALQKNEWEESYKELCLKFKNARNVLRQLLTEEEKADRLRGQLEEVQSQLRHLSELRATDEYKELSSLETRLRDSQAAEDAARRVEQNLSSQALSLQALVTESLELDDYEVRATSIKNAAALLDQAASTLASGREAWEKHQSSAIWRRRVEELNSWLTQQGTGLSAEQTQQYRQKEAQLQTELAGFENSEKRRADQQALIDALMTEIEAKRTELFSRRRDYTSDLSASSSLTRVSVHHQGAISGIGADLRSLLNCPDSFESAFSHDGLAATLINEQVRKPTFPEKVRLFKDALVELVQHGPESKLGKTFKVDSRFYTRISNSDAFDLATDILLWFPEDLVEVHYRTTKKDNFTPVDRGSPGQKTAALLTVILQMGTDPLLLDQPEDDLENKLIRSLAVETLRSIKKGRQFFVSTHNANVVVTSAAENIVALQHGQHVPAIEAEGTLQAPAVRDIVCEILEGGEDAIKTRYSRLIGNSRPTAPL